MSNKENCKENPCRKEREDYTSNKKLENVEKRGFGRLDFIRMGRLRPKIRKRY